MNAFRRCLVFCLLIAARCGMAQDIMSTPDVRFGMHGRAHAFAFDDDDSVVVGGSFDRVMDAQTGEIHARSGLARFHPDGSVDEGFVANVDGEVRAILRYGDALIVAGSFTDINGTTRYRIARIDAQSGAVDPSWHPYIDGYVLAMEPDLDGNFFVGGRFETAGGLLRRNLAKLSPTSSRGIGAFEANADGSVWTMGIDYFGNVFVGGDFGRIGTEFDGSGGMARAYMAKLNAASGAVDGSFAPTINASVYALGAGGPQVYVGGRFTQVGGQFRSCLARVSSTTGALDASWNPSPNNSVFTLANMGSGIVIGGAFTQIGASDRRFVGMVDPTSALATPWAPQADGFVYVQRFSLGNLFFGGDIAEIAGNTVSAAGAVDLNTGAAGARLFVEREPSVRALTGGPSGSVFAAGRFSRISNGANHHTRGHVAKFLANGTLDPDWRPRFNSEVRAIAFEAPNRLFVGGSFTRAEPYWRSSLAALGASGTGAVDALWNPAPDGYVSALATHPQGLFVAGTFDQIGGLSRHHIGKIASGGSGAASAWNPSVDGSIHALAIDAGGAVLIGGDFDTVMGAARNNLARVGSQDSVALDTLWNPSPDGQWIDTLHVDGRGRVWLSGLFDQIGGQSRDGVARLLADGSVDAVAPAFYWSHALGSLPDGSGLVAGDYEQGPQLAAYPGTALPTPIYSDQPIQALHTAADGTLWMAGDFQTIGGLERHHLARASIRHLFADGFEAP